jgi:hypothetical protein
MKLTKDQALYCSKIFTDYFGKFERIDEYMRDQKINSLADVPTALPGCGPEEDLFSDFDVAPNDMEFELVELDSNRWQNYLDITSSHINTSNPGRNIKLAVFEKTTQKWVGFLRFGSPTIMMKPRNEMLEYNMTSETDLIKSFNKSALMGFVIVPAQPFGFNYIGGKLLAAICCSHEVREMINKKYDMNMCLFETTSLYGSTKSVSQYDGMKPFLRFGGVTVSDFLPMMHGDPYENLKQYLDEINGSPIVGEDVSNRKLRIMNTAVSLIKSGLKGENEYEEFCSFIDKTKQLTEKKRYYYCNYGIKNFREIVAGKENVIIKDENYDKHHLENLINWWKKKATNRYETLKSENRLRTEVEVWTNNTEIDIIR